MVQEISEDTDQARQIIAQLQVPIKDLPTLLSLLSSPLGNLGILPPSFRKYNTSPLPEGCINIRKHICLIQSALLQHIAPSWNVVLLEKGAEQLVTQYFCPDGFSNVSTVAGELAMMAYSTIMARPLSELSTHLLERLSLEYPIDRLHSAAFHRRDRDTETLSGMMEWEDCIRNVVMVPAKVANAAGATGSVRSGLEHGSFFNHVSRRCECLIKYLSMKPSKESLPSITYLILKLVNLGLFPASPPVARSQPSFFRTTIPTILNHLKSEKAQEYSAYWQAIFSNIPSSIALQSIMNSLFASLATIDPPQDASINARARVKREVQLLCALIGNPTPDNDMLWEISTGVILGRDWDESLARIFVCWISGTATGGRVNNKAINAFLDMIVDIWSSAGYIKHSLLSRHRYVTSLLIISISYLPANSDKRGSVAFSPAFVHGIGIYIAHLDRAVRRCGMLAAEVAAHVSGKKLDFGDWEEDDPGKIWAQGLRTLILNSDSDAPLDVLEEETENIETIDISTPGRDFSAATQDIKAAIASNEDEYDSDDSITGYASPSSSRGASPTPSELADLEMDPTLSVGIIKVARPVYLAQLGGLIRGPGPKMNAREPREPDKIEMALNCGEELIRKKQTYGTELDENVVDLAHGFLALQDNFELEDFELKRQGIMNALVACAPRKAAPALIEQFFNQQYSINQRFAILNSLALGARELASLSIPQSQIASKQITFPSKMLPPAMHNKYMAKHADSAGTGLLLQIMDGISKEVVDKSNEPAAEKVPELVRERRLRIRKTANISEMASEADSLLNLRLQEPKKISFTEIAAEYFICPLINRFWTFLGEEQAHEQRTAHQEGNLRYCGAGTGLILNPLVLAHFLRTLGILVNASQNAPEWLAIIATDSLEVGLALGTKPISRMDRDDWEEAQNPEERQAREASVLTSALELALVVLDGCIDIDGGRMLGLEHTTLLLGTEEWAGKIFANLEEGIRVKGGGGMDEMKLKRAAAGVLLKVEDIMSKWRRSMIDMI